MSVKVLALGGSGGMGRFAVSTCMDFDNIEEVIIDASAAKGQSQPIIVHSKTDNKSKTSKTSAA